ncbi:MAG TPA: tetraacyldisaccharide 4'-kinase [Terriglobales bacterium]|nr:tetraacyldisaccharide 4'-kinase [Terriglobales bacterium]
MSAAAAALFGAAVQARNALYNHGILASRQLQGPVVSVGNLSVGGSGKTPFIIALGELLLARKIPFDVLSRGYGRDSRGALIVDPAGSPRQFGDEPLLIARRLQVPVVLGEERYAAGLLAEQNFGPRLHLLDDGFQHRQLARNFDIVLLTAEDARDRLLPAGRLREPLSSLARADVLVFTAGADAAQIPAAHGKPIWRARRGILPRNLPPHPVAFCGIARPKNFFAQLRTAGVETSAEAVFRDHHAYNENDVRELLRLRDQSGGGGFVTTEKDAINLGPMLEQLKPLSVVPVQMRLENAAEALGAMLDTLARRGKPVA